MLLQSIRQLISIYFNLNFSKSILLYIVPNNNLSENLEIRNYYLTFIIPHIFIAQARQYFKIVFNNNLIYSNLQYLNIKMSRKYKTKSFRLCRCCYKWRCQCLVPRRRKSHPPFNSGTKLDNKLGLHPKLKAFTPISPAVGSYDPQLVDCKSGVIK